MGQWDERNDGYGAGTQGTGMNAGMGAGTMDETQAQMQQYIENARAELDKYVGAAADFIRERPVACIAGAVAVGFLVGKLASRR